MEHVTGLTKWMWIAIAAWLVTASARLDAAPQQEDEKPPEPRPAESAEFPNVLKDGTLDLDARVYLLDSRNKPFFIPNMSFGDLLNLNRAQALRAEGGELPGYTIDDITVAGQLNGDHVDITATIKVTLSDTALPVTEIPLKLQSCLLSKPVTVEGPGKSQFQVGRNDQPGYTWWLRGEQNSTHVATLVGQSVLQTEGDRQSIQLTLPMALVTIELALPPGYQDVRVRGQGGELIRDPQTGDQRNIKVRCQGGDINISWRSSGEIRPVAGAAEATTKTRLRIDDPREEWEGETEISLTAHGEATVETLVIDLPEGASWLQSPLSSTEQFTISAETNNDGSSAPPIGIPATTPPANEPAGTEQPPSDAAIPDTKSTSESNKTTSRQRTRLTIRSTSRAGLAALLDAIPIRWRWAPARVNGQVSLANITVPSITVRGVDRHEGETALVFPAMYGLEWKSQQGTNLIRQLSIGNIQEQLQYVFSFARQPQGLIVSFRREVNLAKVRPTYLAEIDRGKVKLTGWLKCDFDRSQSAELGLQLGDWTFASAEAISDTLTPFAGGESLEQQVLKDGVVKLSRDLDSELIVSRRQQQLWRFTAYRTLDKVALQNLQLSLPNIVLLATDNSRVKIANASGVLMVTAPGSLAVHWDEANSSALLTDALASDWSSALGKAVADRTLAYRYQSTSDQSPLWSGRVEVLPRRVAVQQTAQVKLDLDAARITQKITLQIANEPLEKLQLISRGSQQISVLVANVPCVIEDSLAVSGAPQLLGTVDVEIRSQVPLPALGTSRRDAGDSADEGTVVTVPLVQLDLPDAITRAPAQVTIQTDRRLSVSTAPSEEASLNPSDAATSETDNDKRWSPVSSSAIELTADQSELELLLRRLDQIDPIPVRVTGAWLQTAITGSTRADRFCARFSTQQESISITLSDPSAQVAIDGIQQNGAQGRVEISLRDLPPGIEHTLEVWTRSVGNLGWVSKIDVVPVVIDGCRSFDRYYWQLVVPSSQHLVVIPDDVTAEWRWSWDRLWWRRVSSLDQMDFENWLSASNQQPLATATNRYVVSCFGSVPNFRVWTVSRLLLWLPIGLFAILCALLVSLWPALRHPAVLVLLAACILGAAAVWPDLAIMLGQTSVLALAVVLLYMLTQAAIESRVRRRSVFTTRPSSIQLETSDQHSLARLGSHASSEVVATTRTQSPMIAEGGGH